MKFIFYISVKPMTSLKKCPSGSSRSRSSHRCRKSLSSRRASSHKKASLSKVKRSSSKKRSSLSKVAKPCAPGQIRDKKSKRCRKSHAQKKVPSYKQHQAAMTHHSEGRHYAPIHHKVSSHSISHGASSPARASALASLGSRLSSARNSFLKSLKRGSDGHFDGGAKKRSTKGKKRASKGKKRSSKAKKSHKAKKRSSRK